MVPALGNPQKPETVPSVMSAVSVDRKRLKKDGIGTESQWAIKVQAESDHARGSGPWLVSPSFLSSLLLSSVQSSLLISQVR